MIPSEFIEATKQLIANMERIEAQWQEIKSLTGATDEERDALLKKLFAEGY